MILVTGATGFIGSSVLRSLGEAELACVGSVQRQDDAEGWAGKRIAVGDLNQPVDWQAALAGVSTVVHTAGIAHTEFRDPAQALDQFNRINLAATISLAEAAAAAGVSRFIFISSVAVYGPLESGEIARETRACNPSGPYGQTKLEAERRLQDTFSGRGMDIIVLRPPMVYGPDCPGNFARLTALVKSGLPLPLGSLHGQRNLLSVAELCGVICLLCKSEHARAGTFNVANPEIVSVPDVITAITRGLGKSSRLFRCPPAALGLIATFTGRRAQLAKLSESVRIDSTKAECSIGQIAERSTMEGMQLAAESFRAAAPGR